MKLGFYPVLGKSDFVRSKGKKIPIWQLLEYQPVGWLYSLAIKAEIVPDSPIVHDCGSFNYRDQDIPTLNGKYVDAYWSIHRYRERSKVGDIIVCPDHLLVGENIRERQEYNLKQAETFIQLAKSYLPNRIPLAVIHGQSLSERLEVAKYLLGLGYRHLGIGGLVSQAREYSINLHIIKTITQVVRSLIDSERVLSKADAMPVAGVAIAPLHEPNAHLHVFGLCSPQYAKAFIQMGLSFDGSTFIREGLGGGMFVSHEEKLIRIPTHCAPKCNCHVCRVLNRHRIDPRLTNKGRTHTMGRIAHNLNLVISTYRKFTPKKKIYLVAGCGKQLSYPAAAKDLYYSQHFQACRRYVEGQNSRWYILSPLHQVINPEAIIKPYDKSPYSLSHKERILWAQQVAESLIQVASPEIEFVFLTGKLYRQEVTPILKAKGYETKVPMQHLAIGQQLAWIKKELEQEKQLVLDI
ncbi:DUF6884 domain-containing protein [Nostoc sp. 'Peltigera membranacea cyanobiont' N6]|uniref:DUF6884 domain-containing protein n=1 Tax=Nostoc sp. 'Peltigera membranacea cyanobiont' N6 TaxID=1261031 RepID=UPI000CF35536|nr:DUF6884 domain-containing protein [Nostoc sp. 'Peltigera membranacea cyanobiont' N6]AVH63502.1 hypothetical protein NPM_1689 [Nostoc sp. 'Peltigera membranacea cyanobiont' N6]